MEALNQWLSAQSSLTRAASDFLNACATLKTSALQPVVSCYDRDTLEAALDRVRSHIKYVTLVEDQLKESRIALNVLLNTSTTHVPINRLPSELLSNIFAIVAGATNCHKHYHRRDYLGDIRLACARWNRIATNTPLFWSHIYASLNLALETLDISSTFDSIRLGLERSRGVPLHLHFSGTSKISDHNLSELVSIIRPHFTRVNSLIVSGTRASSLVRGLFELYSSLGRPGTLKSLNVANLQERHEALSITWAVSSLSGLAELDLEGLRQYASPLFSELVSLLSNCPALHALRLRFLGVRASPEQEYPVIHLPCLRLLELGIVDDQEEILRLLPLLAPGVYELDVRLNIPYVDPSHIASHIRPLLERSNVTFLSFLDSLPEYSTEFKTLFASAPRLRALLLHYTPSDSLEVIRELLSSTRDDSARPLPDLQCLCLVTCTIDSEAMDRVGCVIAERSSFPGVSDSDEDEDEEVEVGERWSRELEDMRGRFSGQVEKIIVGPLPRPRIYNGVDLSILELTTND